MASTTASNAGYHFAIALLRSGRKAGDLAKIGEDLGRVVALMSAERLLVFYLMHPLVPPGRKEEVLGLLCETEIVRRLVRLLVETKHLGFISEVYWQFSEMARKELGVVRASARVADGLEPAEETRLKQAIEAATGKRVELEVKADPSLLAGVRVRIGDTVIDNTLKRELEAVKERLVSS